MEHKREFAFTDKDFQFLVKMVAEKTGIVLAEHKRDMIYGRVARRVRSLSLNSVQEYCDLLKGEKGNVEIVDFVNAVTTNLTRFFRESHHFDHLKKELLSPMVVKPPAGKRVRLWSAGSSSGMEAYSMAMTASDAIPNIQQWDLRILATDIDTNMLAKGSSGIYRKQDVQDVPDGYKKRFITRHGGKESDEVQISEDLRRLISFKQLNFLEKWPVKGPFDAIFCRNVVIYFNKDTQKVLFDQFAEVMKPGGWLYIGHSENLHGVTDRFRLEGRTIYQKVK